MGIGVGIVKQELSYDLSAANFTWSLRDSSNKDTRVARIVHGVYFRFTTKASKTVEIVHTITKDAVEYSFFIERKKLPSQTQWVWHQALELPGNVNITINVFKTTSACSMNMVVIGK